MRKLWIDKEIEFLENNYNDFSNTELSKKMDRSVSSIEKKLKSLGLKKSSKGLSMSKNYEYRLMLSESYILPDFYIPSIKKIIEFDGTYYHRDNIENKKRERKRDLDIIKNDLKVYHVSESDYKKDKEGTIIISMELTANGNVQFSYSDSGAGFDIKKFENSEGFGLELIKTLISQLSDDYYMNSTNGFNLIFDFKRKSRGSYSNL
jgi:very-short-patch-repair endonuclease